MQLAPATRTSRLVLLTIGILLLGRSMGIIIEQWATVEINLARLWASETIFTLQNSLFSMVVFVALAGFLGYFLFTRRKLRELDSLNVIPGRVQEAFNVFKEGVLIVDEDEHIVLANTSFAETVGKPPEMLVGFRVSELGWRGYSSQRRRSLPWFRVLEEGKSRTGVPLVMERPGAAPQSFVVNAAPVMDDRGGRRRVLVTFEKVAELEEKNQELNQIVTRLQIFTEQVQSRNKELEYLATHDSLTQLLNRRALNRGLERVFSEARQQGRELSCIMCDIDQFKSVNDRYGHAVGDEVIRMVAANLQKNSRESDLVCRWGGEEFCILLPGLDIRQAAKIAGRMRLAVQYDTSAGVSVTISFGVSSLRSHARNAGELFNQADKALYIAKEGGRNRVVCWDEEEIAVFAGQSFA